MAQKPNGENATRPKERPPTIRPIKHKTAPKTSTLTEVLYFFGTLWLTKAKIVKTMKNQRTEAIGDFTSGLKKFRPVNMACVKQTPRRNHEAT